MITRRQILTKGGLLGALVSAGEEPALAAGQSSQISDANARDIVQGLKGIENELAEPRAFAEIKTIRTRQMDFLRAQGKFPDFIEVGVDVWLAAHDWHVRHLQQTTLGRDASGRYTLTLMFTTLILRSDMVANFIGVPG